MTHILNTMKLAPFNTIDKIKNFIKIVNECDCCKGNKNSIYR